MSAPKQFSIPAPVKATEIPQKRESAGSRNRGPNLFLQPQDGFPKGYLWKSFEDGDWYDLPVSGGLVLVEGKRGKSKGQEIEKLDGDAAEVVRQLREAATALGIGVSVKYFDVLAKGGPNKGQPVAGKILIKYLGQPRKQRRAQTEA